MKNWNELIKQNNHINKYGTDNEMELEILNPGHVIYKMTIQEKHLSTPNVCHGGVIAGLMDSTMGAAALTKAIDENNFISTIELKINYLQPAFMNDVLVGEGKVDYKGKSTIVASGKIYKEVDNTLVAIAIGTFNVYPISKRKDLIPEN